MREKSNFQHFVITRFNLKKFEFGIDNTKDWISWTKKRIILFKEYCLPSFINQTNKNFIWLIYFDSQTPIEFNDLFTELDKVNFIKYFFVDGEKDFLSKYLIDIKSLCLNKKWIITTRCDNDDCLDKDAINTIQKYFQPKNEFLISLASGYTLNINDFTLSKYYYPKSPFLSLVESNSDQKLKGIFYKRHTEWKNLNFKISTEVLKRNVFSSFVFEKPLWLQIIHGNNIANGHRRGVPVLNSISLKDFGLQIKTNKQSIFKIFEYREYYFWKRYIKSLIVRKIT